MGLQSRHNEGTFGQGADEGALQKTLILIAIVIFHRKTNGARRGVGVAARGDHAIVGRGKGWARALLGCGHLGHPPTLPFELLKPLDLNIDGGFVILRETHLRSEIGRAHV